MLEYLQLTKYYIGDNDQDILLKEGNSISFPFFSFQTEKDLKPVSFMWNKKQYLYLYVLHKMGFPTSVK